MNIVIITTINYYYHSLLLVKNQCIIFALQLHKYERAMKGSFETPKSRLALALGLLHPPRGQTIPLRRGASERVVENIDSGHASLSVMGGRNDLAPTGLG